MAVRDLRPEATGLLLVDLQNDFLHPEGACGRAGRTAPEIAALAALATVAAVVPCAEALARLGAP